MTTRAIERAQIPVRLARGQTGERLVVFELLFPWHFDVECVSLDDGGVELQLRPRGSRW